MKIKYYANSLNNTIFEAVPESDEEWYGYRAQGPYPLLDLEDTKLEIEYPFNDDIHPDIIGYISLCIFYPFIKSNVSFPKAVSQKFSDSISILPIHTIKDGNYTADRDIIIDNVDSNLVPYIGNSKAKCIAFGSGIDSTCTSLMFPEASLIHQLETEDHADLISSYIKKLNAKRKCEDVVVSKSNITQLVKQKGFPCFTSIFIIPLLHMAKLGGNIVYTGSILEANFLSNGIKFFDQADPKRLNRWIRLAREIGVEISSPIVGCSEILTTKLVYEFDFAQDVIFCHRNNGNNCYSCAKCLRKCLSVDYVSRLLNNEPFYSKDFWYNFKEATIDHFIDSRPILYFATLLNTTLIDLENKPSYFKKLRRIVDKYDLNTDFNHRYYPPSLNVFKEENRKEIEAKLNHFFAPMINSEIENIKSVDIANHIKFTMKKRIFCIGLNKTGTSSLHEAFKVLGLNSVHYRDDNGNSIKKIIQDNYFEGNDILKGLEEYDAFSDWDQIATAHIIFKEFVKQYPNSKFILNTRNVEDWLDSREKHVKRNQALKASNPDLPLKWLTIDREKWEKQFKRHHNEVLNYFKGRENDLLIFDVTKGDGWHKLCTFLEMPIPQMPFPRKNVATN